MAVALTAGKERIYLQHIHDRLTTKRAAIAEGISLQCDKPSRGESTTSRRMRRGMGRWRSGIWLWLEGMSF